MPFFQIKDDAAYRKSAISRWQPAIHENKPVYDRINTMIYDNVYDYERLVVPFSDYKGRATKLLIHSEIVSCSLMPSNVI